MNLHDFVTEHFNPVHIFRDVHNVLFSLNTDHITMCLMSVSARFKPAQFLVGSGHVVNGKCGICSHRRDTVWGRIASTLGVS